MQPTGEFDRSLYWMIQFDGSSVEWLYLVNKLMRSRPIQNFSQYFIGQTESGEWVYALAKAVYPAVDVAKTFGLSVAQLASLETLHLHPLVPKAPIPAPTVSYWGEA